MSRPYSINALGKKITRGYIVRDDTNEMILFQFNPSEWTEGWKAIYTIGDSPGSTYPEINYMGQSARSYPITVYLDEFVKTDQNKDKTMYVRNTLRQFRALTKPSKTLAIMRRGNKMFCETPTCRFVFGGRVIKCKIPEVKIKHTNFDKKLKTTSAVVDVEILEVM